ncbi:hypothetical protein V2O64_11215 [Verrucomicrobiaceae bacterium 227]
MKLAYLLFIAFLSFSCTNKEQEKQSVVLTLEPTSQRKGGSKILSMIGGHVIQINEGQCKLRFDLIKSGKIEALGEARFDSSLGKVAYITPAVLGRGKCAIDAYIPELKVTRTENSYEQISSMGLLTYEFDTPKSFGAPKLSTTLSVEKTSLIFAYLIEHQKGVPLGIDYDDSIKSMLQRSKKGDVSFLAIIAEPVE